MREAGKDIKLIELLPYGSFPLNAACGEDEGELPPPISSGVSAKIHQLHDEAMRYFFARRIKKS